MKVIQIVKKLNNTELGKAHTNETYVLIPNDLDISDVFEVQKKVEFTDKITNEKVIVRHTNTGEKRIVGLGPYYRSKNLCAGDEIIFEKQIQCENVRYWIYTKKNSDLVVKKSKHGFEILTPERLDEFKKNILSMKIDAKIEYIKSQKKRTDSPIETDYYNIIFSGNSLMDSNSVKGISEIKINNNKILVSTFYGWKKYSFDMED